MREKGVNYFLLIGILHFLKHGKNGIFCIAWSHKDSKRIATCSSDGFWWVLLEEKTKLLSALLKSVDFDITYQWLIVKKFLSGKYWLYQCHILVRIYFYIYIFAKGRIRHFDSETEYSFLFSQEYSTCLFL